MVIDEINAAPSLRAAVVPRQALPHHLAQRLGVPRFERPRAQTDHPVPKLARKRIRTPAAVRLELPDLTLERDRLPRPSAVPRVRRTNPCQPFCRARPCAFPAMQPIPTPGSHRWTLTCRAPTRTRTAPRRRIEITGRVSMLQAPEPSNLNVRQHLASRYTG